MGKARCLRLRKGGLGILEGDGGRCLFGLEARLLVCKLGEPALAGKGA